MSAGTSCAQQWTLQTCQRSSRSGRALERNQSGNQRAAPSRTVATRSLTNSRNALASTIHHTSIALYCHASVLLLGVNICMLRYAPSCAPTQQHTGRMHLPACVAIEAAVVYSISTRGLIAVVSAQVGGQWTLDCRSWAPVLCCPDRRRQRREPPSYMHASTARGASSTAWRRGTQR